MRCWRKTNAISTSSNARSSLRSLRYGVSGRRKRNMRRVGELKELREHRRTYRAAAGDVAITAGSAAPSGARVIEAIGISKRYGDRAIVAEFSTRIQRGDRLGIVGPNGSGKTTLISLLTGALAPKREGRDMREATRPALSIAAEPPAVRRRLTFKDKHALETLPKTIAVLQEDMRKLQTTLNDPQFYARDRAGFENTSGALGELQERIAAAEEQWLELEILREELAGG